MYLCKTRLILKDNCFSDRAEVLCEHNIQPNIEPLLNKYDGKTLHEWSKMGVAVFPISRLDPTTNDDGVHNQSVFTLTKNNCNGIHKCWINTHNCMGVVRLHSKSDDIEVQIAIGSRFDKNGDQYFLTYLLSKVFGGSIVDLIELGKDSVWDLLLAFLFRRKLLEAYSIGIFKQYRTVRYNDARVRGRIDLNRHLQRNIPFRGNIAYNTGEIAFDNPTNHLIRHAMGKVAKRWGALLMGDGRLTGIRHHMEQHTPTWKASELLACIRQKENRFPIKHPYFQAVYEPLRLLSLSILRDEGARLYGQQQEAEGVLFDGAWLWEEYLWTLLKPLGFDHPENTKQTGVWKPLKSISFYPDFFHKNARVVLDAKYRRGNVTVEIAHQILSYMFCMDAVHGGMINPDGVPKTANERETVKKLAERDDDQKAYWHNIALIPPSEHGLHDFLVTMKKREDDFTKRICLILSEKNSE